MVKFLDLKKVNERFRAEMDAAVRLPPSLRR